MKNKRDDDVFCSSGKDESQSVLYSPCWRRNFHAHRLHYFCWATLHLPSIYMHHTATRSLAQVAGLFSMRGRWSFPRSVPVPDDEIWRPFGFRFPFTTIPCVLEDGRGVHLRSRWLSPCLIRFVVLSRGFTLHLILPSGYYFDLRIYECFQFVLRLCHHFHHVYVATLVLFHSSCSKQCR